MPRQLGQRSLPHARVPTRRPDCAVLVAGLEELHERGIKAVVVHQDDGHLLGVKGQGVVCVCVGGGGGRGVEWGLGVGGGV